MNPELDCAHIKMAFKWLWCFNVACSCTSDLCQWTWEWRKIWTICWSDSSREKMLARCWRRRQGSRITSRRKGRTRTVSEGRKSTRQNWTMVHQRRSKRLLGGGYHYLAASWQLATLDQSQNWPFLTALLLWLAHLLKFCLTRVFGFSLWLRLCVCVFLLCLCVCVLWRLDFFLAQLSSVSRHGHSNRVSEFDHVQSLEFPV